MTARVLPLALALFAIGVLAVVAIFVLSALNHQAPWLWGVSMLAPIGLVLGVVAAVRRR